MGYIGFSDSSFSSDFKDNWFMFFKSDNYFILVLRILNIIQLISIFPILFFSVRKQLFSLFFEKYLNSLLHLIIFSLILLSLCVLVLYFFYDTLGKLIGYVGASTSIVLIYTIPPLTNMIYFYIRHRNKKEAKKLKNESIEASNLNATKNMSLFLLEPLQLEPIKAYLFYLSMMIIILIGIITVILQFANFNIFNIKIKAN